MKCQAGWSTSWNQDCWEKYQQPHICRWHPYNGRKWRKTKKPLDEGEEASEKSWLKLNVQKDHGIQSYHFMANRRGESGKQWQILFSWAPKSPQTMTAAIKLKMLAPWKESYDKPKVCLGKAMVFPVVMYGYESLPVKRVECWKSDVSKLWC